MRGFRLQAAEATFPNRMRGFRLQAEGGGRANDSAAPDGTYLTSNVVSTGRWSLGITPFESRVS